jgi:hypothetical protein
MSGLALLYLICLGLGAVGVAMILIDARRIEREGDRVDRLIAARIAEIGRIERS